MFFFFFLYTGGQTSPGFFFFFSSFECADAPRLILDSKEKKKRTIPGEVKMSSFFFSLFYCFLERKLTNKKEEKNVKDIFESALLAGSIFPFSLIAGCWLTLFLS